MDPAAFARVCLEDELFGPARELERDEINARVADLSGARRAEAVDLLSGRVTQRHREFRRALDQLADAHGTAVRAVMKVPGIYGDLARRGLGVGQPPNWAILSGLEDMVQRQLETLRTAESEAAAHQAAWHRDLLDELRLVWGVVHAICRFVDADLPALGRLPWTPEWMLRLAAGRPPEWRYAHGPRVSGVFGGGFVRTLTLTVRDLDLPDVERDWSDSKEEMRERFVAALEPLFFQRYVEDTGRTLDRPPDAEFLRHDRRFRIWLKRDRRWKAAQAAIEQLIRRTYPEGDRPYSRDPLRQVRRNVGLWVAVEIDGKAAWALADAHAKRFEADSTFYAGSGDRRPRLPVTAKGVMDAVTSAEKLLQQRP